MHTRNSWRLVHALAGTALVVLVAVSAGAGPIRPKVLILTTFEIGADTGDRPGELQYWVEREHLTGSVDVPGLIHPVRFNDSGVYAMVTGTCNRSGLAVMLLGTDPDFDLRKTYFMMAGIAGVDASRASVGSAAWAQWVVDGDNANEIDDHDAGSFPSAPRIPTMSRGPATGARSRWHSS
jgi:purine nucleoside permease